MSSYSASVSSSKFSLRRFASRFSAEARTSAEEKRVAAVRAKGQASIDAQMRQAQRERSAMKQARSSLNRPDEGRYGTL